MTREEAVRSVTKALGEKRFEWGLMDCCQIARAVYIAYRGHDPAPGFSYTSKEKAEEIMANYGGLRGLLSHILGESTHVDNTSTADVLLLKLPGIGEFAGVRVPDGALAPLRVGLYKVPLSYALEGWRI